MDGLTQLVTQGNSAALKLVKSALTTPTLLNTDINQGHLYAIPLDCETYKQSSTAQVSENLLIVKDGKKNIADNVAPGAWQWDLSGYIPGNKMLEPSNYYTPFVRLNTDILKQWFKLGAVLVFKDMEARLYKQVVIQNLTIEHQKDCTNAAPFSMTLKEINTVENDEEQMVGKVSSLISSGSGLGKAVKVGVQIATVAATATNATTNTISAVASLF